MEGGVGLPCVTYNEGAIVVGPKFLQQTKTRVRFIQKRVRKKPLEFEVGHHVFLTITPTTRVGRVLKSKKLSSMFIRPNQIRWKIEPITYEITLPLHFT